VILPRFCLIFLPAGAQMHCGRQSAAHFELQREFPHLFFAIFGLVKRNFGGSEKIFYFFRHYLLT
jgi:hypothetical protein